MDDSSIYTDEIEIMIRARYPIIYITSWEEKRVENDLIKIASRTEKKIFSWTSTQGLVNLTLSKSSLTVNDSTRDLYSALDTIHKSVDPALYIIKDIHHYLNDP
ncbi:MAG: ATPase, partial [Candidatus Sericytochromatia bacterium]